MLLGLLQALNRCKCNALKRLQMALGVTAGIEQVPMYYAGKVQMPWRTARNSVRTTAGTTQVPM